MNTCYVLGRFFSCFDIVGIWICEIFSVTQYFNVILCVKTVYLPMQVDT